MTDLAVVDRWGRLNISTFHVDGLQPRLVLVDVRWPSWVSTSALAYSRVDGDGPRVEVQRVDGTSASPVVVYRTAPGVDAVLGPGTPHYINPAPGGQHLAIVAPQREDMALFVVRTTDGERIAQLLGAPIFSCWSSDGRFLASHAGSDLHVVDTQSSSIRVGVRNDAVGFRAPAVGPEGELAYVGRSGRILAIGWARADGAGWAPGPLTQGGAVGNFRPQTAELWLATRPIGSTGLLSRLVMTVPGSITVATRYRGPFSAFSWSPSGRKLVVAIPRQPGDDRTSLLLLDEEGTVCGESETFFPSDDQRALWSFFDQYGHSHGSWLVADGVEYFVACGRPGTDRVSPSLGGSAGNRVLLWRPGRREPLSDVGAGEIAVPSPSSP